MGLLFEDEAHPPAEPKPQSRKAVTGLFVATNLESWETDDPHYFADDIEVCGTLYRRLDLAYYVWLRIAMVKLYRMNHKGIIDPHVYEMARDAFEPIRDFALKTFGEDRVALAIKHGLAPDYVPPMPSKPSEPAFLYPKEGDFPYFREVSPEALIRMDAECEKLEAQGYTRAQLYQNRSRFAWPYGPDWGLVCFFYDNGITMCYK